ncbi:MAG: DUF669 domain-containing protein [Deltaproteobacteria bacterium]|nr:DUF669 domain-containing protein [Deltaproteobacteria bacterium]
MGSSFGKRLGKMQGNWESSKSLGGTEFEDGIYKLQLEDAELVESQNTSKLMIKWGWVCLEGDMAGENIRDYSQLESESDWARKFAMQRIEKLGREVPDQMADLEEVIEEIADANPIVMVKVKTSKDGFTNITITRLLDGDAAVVGGEDDGEPEDEDAEEDGDADDDDGDEDGEEDADEDGDDSDGDEDGEDEDEGGDDEEEDLDELIALAQTLEAKVKEDDDVESLVKRLKKFEYDSSELVEEEVELCEKHGIKLSEPEPEPKSKKKAKAKKKSKDKPKAKDKKKKKSKKKKKTKK